MLGRSQDAARSGDQQSEGRELTNAEFVQLRVRVIALENKELASSEPLYRRRRPGRLEHHLGGRLSLRSALSPLDVGRRQRGASRPRDQNQ